jgi:hypothetical protein
MSGYINGYRYPRFIIKTSAGLAVETINLSLCGRDGLLETYDFNLVTVEQENMSKYQKSIGGKITFTLNYSDHSNRTNSLNIGKIIDYILEIHNYKIFLIPRSEYTWRVFEVIYSGDPIDLQIAKGGVNSRGMKGLVLKFETKDKVTDVNWWNPSLDQYLITTNVIRVLYETA